MRVIFLLIFLIFSGPQPRAADLPEFATVPGASLPQIQTSQIWVLNEHERKISQILLEGAFGKDHDRIAAFDKAVGYLESLTTGQLIDLLLMYVTTINNNDQSPQSQMLGNATLNNPENMTNIRTLIAGLIESEIHREDLVQAVDAARLARGILRRDWASFIGDNLNSETLKESRDVLDRGVTLVRGYRADLKSAKLDPKDATTVVRLFRQAVDQVVFGRSAPGEKNYAEWINLFTSVMDVNTADEVTRFRDSNTTDESPARDVLMSAMEIKDIRFRLQRIADELSDMDPDNPKVMRALRDQILGLDRDLHLEKLVGDGFFVDFLFPGKQGTTTGGDGQGVTRSEFDQWITSMGSLQEFIERKTGQTFSEQMWSAFVADQDIFSVRTSTSGPVLSGQLGMGYELNLPLLPSEEKAVIGWIRNLTQFPRSQVEKARGLISDARETHLPLLQDKYADEVALLVENFFEQANQDDFFGEAPVNTLTGQLTEAIVTATEGRVWVDQTEISEIGQEFLSSHFSDFSNLSQVLSVWTDHVADNQQLLISAVQNVFWSVTGDGQQTAAVGGTGGFADRIIEHINQRVADFIDEIDAITPFITANQRLTSDLAQLRASLGQWNQGLSRQLSRSVGFYMHGLRQDARGAGNIATGVREGLKSWLSQRPSPEKVRAQISQTEQSIIQVLNKHPENAQLVATTRQVFAYLRGDGDHLSPIEANSRLATAAFEVLKGDPERQALGKLLEDPAWAQRIGESILSLAQKLGGVEEFDASPEWKINFMKNVDAIAEASIEEIRAAMKDLAASPEISLEFEPFEVFLRIVIEYYYKFRPDIEFRSMLIALIGMEGDDVKDFLGIILAHSGVGIQKLLQVMARERGVGPELRELFEVLESELPALPFDEVHEILIKTIPKLYPAKFRSISREGKRGSMAQLHLAELELPDGSTIDSSVRFLIPGSIESIAIDRRIFERIAGVIAKHPVLKDSGINQVEDLLNSTFGSIDEEASAEQTAINIQEAEEILEGQRTHFIKINGKRQEVIFNFVVPSLYYPEVAKKGVIIQDGVTDFVKFSKFFGQNPILGDVAAADIVGLVLGNALIRGNGMFHGDLHQGNLGVSMGETPLRIPKAKTENPIIINIFIFDLGIVGHLGEVQGDIFRLSLALLNGDEAKAVELTQSILAKPLDQDTVREAVKATFARAAAANEAADVGYLATELTKRGGSILDTIIRLNRTIGTSQQFLIESGSAIDFAEVLRNEVKAGLFRESAHRLKSILMSTALQPHLTIAIDNREFVDLIRTGVKQACDQMFLPRSKRK